MRNTISLTCRFALAVTVYLAAIGFSSAESALGYFRAWNMQLLIPFMLFFYIIAGFRHRAAAD